MQRPSYGERDYSFGQMMLTLRTTIGLTQAGLASQLGVSRNAIAQWEGGNSYPKAKHLQHLIELGVQAFAFPAQHEEEAIRALWRAARQKVLLDEHWFRELLHRSSVSSSEQDLVGATQRTQTMTNGITLWTVPFPRNGHFTGRHELLDQLTSQLTSLASSQPTTIRRAVLTQSQVIKGLGGIGKTQIAVEYAYRAREMGHYIHTFWISAANEETLLMSFAALAEHLPSVSFKKETDQRKLVTAVIRWLEQCQESWLLILDNADDLSMVHPYLPVQGHGSLLFTTRSSAVGWLAPSLEVSTMGVIEGAELLLRRAGRFAQASDEHMNEAATLATELALFPLALDQAGAYIEETGCGVTDYLQLYQTHRRILLSRRGRQAIGYPHSVATTWELSFRHIQATNPASADLLRLCAFLSPDAIPEEVLTKGASHWPPALQAAVADRLSFNQMLEALLAFSLIQRFAEDHSLSIHRLVQVVQRERLSPEEQRQWMVRVVRVLNAVFPQNPQDSTSWPICSRYLDQVQDCAALVREQHALLPEASELLKRAGAYLYERGLYTPAAQLYQHALSMREQLVGETDPASISAMAYLARIYFSQGAFTEAEALYQRALSIVEQYTEAEPLLFIDVLRGLAHVYGDQGKYAQAEVLYQRALSIWEQLAEAEQIRRVGILGSLAFVKAQQGKYTEAIILSQRMLRLREQHVGPDHPSVASALLGLAQITTLKDEDAPVEHLNLRALRIYEQHFGPEHPLVAMASHALARLYTGQGKYVEAEPLYQRALHMREQQLGPENLDVADTLRGLADLYYKEKKYTEAEPLYQRALSIRVQQLGPENSIIIDVLLGLANLYRDQEQYTQAEPLYLRALCISKLYLERVETTHILHDFAYLQQMQGKTKEAVTLYQWALLIRERILGSEHPLAVKTRKCLQVASQ
ncbi:tetratricopeptide repeat protein [Ktedonobacter sp. SOSP1-85]|uniref:FxSxx-COOH system tetratricopeptide repeat protein n=1 Tax=Ktedonobacter sp. SOSP1-85 TaxID=2778367 RepID=UPI001915FB6A|nr:FxSxx-COOH system tetratricopeptide repeat protein [Ktedonobacter sp. SOSP1-85]GHO79704.1 tetratricopeptide repeat protein [Ktedonobacter sp. SOSP1-85]